MSDTTVLDYLKSHIGKPLSDSPSTFARWLNGTVMEVEEGSISVKFEVRHEMLNPIQTVHGGVLAAILDEMIGMCVFTLHLDHVYASVNLNVDFLETAQEGDELVAKTVIIRKGGRLVNGQCEIFKGDRCIARATSSLYKTPFKLKDVIERHRQRSQDTE